MQKLLVDFHPSHNEIKYILNSTLSTLSSDQQKTSQRKSLADENDTLKRKMQKELEQKRKEYLLEAENVVRIREEAFNQELLKLQTELDHQKRIQVLYYCAPPFYWERNFFSEMQFWQK